MSHRIVWTLLLALALVGLPAAAARADTISITTGADPTEEVPLPINVSWSSTSNSSAVYVTIKPAGPFGCGANYDADDPNSSDVIWDGGSGVAAGSLSHNWTLDNPGTYTLCGYLEDSGTTSPRAVTGPVALNVRSARATVAVNAPARVDANQKFSLSFPVTAELQRALFVTIKPAGGRGCEATYSLDDPNSSDVIWDRSVQGTVTATADYTASATKGTYLLCAYVEESESDPAPEATSSATFLVGPDPCVTAKSALSKAQKAVKVAEAAVTRNRTAYRRYQRQARRAHGHRRITLQRKAKLYKSRYVSAVRSRAKARAKLATAQATVNGACG